MTSLDRIWNPELLLDIKTQLTNKALCTLFEPIFRRYQETTLILLIELTRSENDHFNTQKLYQLSKILSNKITKAEEIYFTADQVIREYCEQYPLTEIEAEILFDFMIIDLCCYLLAQGNESNLSNNNVRFIQKWTKFDPYFLTAIARNATGHFATAEYEVVVNWLNSNSCQPKKLFDFDLSNEDQVLLRFDQSQDHVSMIHDVKAHQNYVENLLGESNAKYAIGLYGEDRACYQAAMFQSEGCYEKRSVHLGIDVFLNAGENLHAPIAGKVFSLKYNSEELDYGYTIILEHTTGDNRTKFYTLYGHLSHRTLDLIKEGDIVEAGTPIGYIGDNTENGGWSPHLHFQIMTNMLSCTGDFYGACEPTLWHLWTQICPDPNLLMKVLIKK